MVRMPLRLSTRMEAGGETRILFILTAIHHKIQLSLQSRFDTLVNCCNAASQVLISTARDNKPGLLDQATEFFLVREALNTLDEVLIAVTVTSNNLAKERDSAEIPALVESVQNRIVYFAELHARKWP